MPLGGTIAPNNTPILAAKLNERNISLTARHGLLRVSLHLYSNEADIDHFAEAVTQATNPPA
jgi:selenocysteine lyase/cysteine desulfurase